jgi:hypothetical protein
MDAPRAFYCPSQTDERWMFATAANPFPPVLDEQTRMGLAGNAHGRCPGPVELL